MPCRQMHELRPGSEAQARSQHKQAQNPEPRGPGTPKPDSESQAIGTQPLVGQSRPQGGLGSEGRGLARGGGPDREVSGAQPIRGGAPPRRLGSRTGRAGPARRWAWPSARRGRAARAPPRVSGLPLPPLVSCLEPLEAKFSQLGAGWLNHRQRQQHFIFKMTYMLTI